jgi:hypothetical protein
MSNADGEWCVVANVKPEAFGRATTPGTKVFVAGTKLWCVDWYWGMGGENVRVLGRHRGGSRLVLVTTRSDYLTNWRAKVAYHPHVVRMLREVRPPVAQEDCERTAAFFAGAHPAIPDLRDQTLRLALALQLISEDPHGRELAAAATAVLDATEPTVALAVVVLSEFLEARGARLSLEQLRATLRRRRDNGPKSPPVAD